MKLNVKKFIKTELGGELEATIRAWDEAITEVHKLTPGFGNPDQGLGLNTGTILVEVVGIDGKCLSWQSSSSTESNFSLRELIHIMVYALKMKAFG